MINFQFPILKHKYQYTLCDCFLMINKFIYIEFQKNSLR